MAIFGDFLGPAFPASRAQQHISDLHSKFALRPHHVSKCGIDIQSAAAEIRRGKKIEDGRKKPQDKNIKKPHDKNIMACPITQGGHKQKMYNKKYKK